MDDPIIDLEYLSDNGVVSRFSQAFNEGMESDAIKCAHEILKRADSIFPEWGQTMIDDALFVLSEIPTQLNIDNSHHNERLDND